MTDEPGEPVTDKPSVLVDPHSRTMEEIAWQTWQGDKMGHDAKVSLKHYAQTTEEHFDRAASGAESGAREARKPAQQPPAGNRGEWKSPPVNTGGEVVVASPCDVPRDSVQTSSGEGGIRTRGPVLPGHRFSKAALSTTQPPLRRGRRSRAAVGES